jgi:hypothetical protein
MRAIQRIPQDSYGKAALREPQLAAHGFIGPQISCGSGVEGAMVSPTRNGMAPTVDPSPPGDEPISDHLITRHGDFYAKVGVAVPRRFGDRDDFGCPLLVSGEGALGR